MFHVWGAYVCLSAAVSRKVWLVSQDGAIYPNIYVMYVGKAGNGKSVAMQKARRLIAEIPTIHTSKSVETPEGLWRFMNGDPKANPPVPSPVKFLSKWPDGVLRDCHPLTIIANEFVNFIGMNQQGWINALCDIYDEDAYTYRTKNMGEDILMGPYITLLGALTTDVSADLQKARIISSGFARRTLFQYGERSWYDPVAWPELTEEQIEARTRCVIHMKQLNDPKVHGVFKFEPGLIDWYKDWYNENLRTVTKQSPQTEGWFASKSTQVMKLGMLTSLSEGTDLILRICHLEAALGMLGVLEKDLHRIFGGIGRNELAAVSFKILDYVENYGEPIAASKLKARFFNDCKPPSEYDDCLAYLTGEGVLKQYTFQVNGTWATVIGTPEQVLKFDASLKASALRAGVTPTSASLDSLVANGQSTLRGLPPESPQREHLNESGSAVGTEDAGFLMEED